MNTKTEGPEGPRAPAAEAPATPPRATPPGEIDFYVDFTSPYSYLAAEAIEAIGARYAHRVNWIPVMLGVLFKATGGIALTSLHPWKSAYSVMDFARSAEFAGVPFRMPSTFPQASQNASRALIWLQRTSPGKANDFAMAVFRLLFVEDGRIDDVDALARVAAPLGIDEAGLRDAVRDPEIKAALAANNEDAASRHVFGAPTFFIGTEQFWGNDRLSHVEARLARLAGGRSHKVLLDAADRRIRTRTIDEAIAAHGSPGVVFVDLRDPRELERDGMVEGAVHAPRGMLEFWIDPSSPYYRDVFKPEHEYILYCAGGLRSALAAQTCVDMGLLPNVSHVQGGYAAWKAAGGPWVARGARPAKAG
ncbi:MAG: DsbA family protein [Lautropia sp.]